MLRVLYGKRPTEDHPKLVRDSGNGQARTSVLSGLRTEVNSVSGGREYVSLVSDCYPRFTGIYFLKSKSEAVDYFICFLCDERADGIPSTVQRVH